MIDDKEFKKFERKIKIFSVKLTKSGSEILKETDDTFKWGANEIRNRIIQSMQDTPRNYDRSYKRTKTGKVHHPSLPYNPPAIDFGDLVASIFFKSGKGYVEIGGWREYYPHLEKGTARMDPRPSLEPAIDEIMPNIIRKLGLKTDKVLSAI